MTEIKIALEIVEEHYGPLAKRICKYVSNNGTVSYAQILRSLKSNVHEKATQQNITDCVLSLLLHKILEFDVNLDNEEKLIQGKYHFCPINALYRLRLGEYISYIHSIFGNIGSAIMVQYAVRGAALSSDVIDSILDSDKEGAFTYEAVKNTLDAMKSQGYITSFIDIKSKKKTLQLQKEALQRNEANTRKKGRSHVVKAPTEPTYKSIVASSTSGEGTEMVRTRKRKIATLAERILGDTTKEEMNLTKRIKLEKEKIKTKEEEKEKEEEEVEKEEEEEDQTKNILFCINYVMYTRIIRNEIIIHYVSNRINPTVGEIMKVILNKMNLTHSTQFDTHNGQSLGVLEKPKEVSAAFTGREIFSKLDDNFPVSFSLFVNYLKDLCSDRLCCLDCITPADSYEDYSGGTYCITLTKVMNKIKEETIGAYIERRLNSMCVRLWRVLLKHKKLDEQQLSTIAMIPLKLTRTSIVLLQNDRFIRMQEVPKKSDHHPTTTYYLWGVDQQATIHTMLNIIYECLLNLKMKEKAVINSHAGLYDLFARNLLSSQEKAQLNQIEGSLCALSYSCLHLDRMIAILRDL